MTILYVLLHTHYLFSMIVSLFIIVLQCLFLFSLYSTFLDMSLLWHFKATIWKSPIRQQSCKYSFFLLEIYQILIVLCTSLTCANIFLKLLGNCFPDFFKLYIIFYISIISFVSLISGLSWHLLLCLFCLWKLCYW